MSIDRNKRERDRLRKKRRDPKYLKRERANRAAQMAAMRLERGRGKNGECWDCTNQAVGGIYCERCQERERKRRSQ